MKLPENSVVSWRPATGARGGRLPPAAGWLAPFGDGGAGRVPQGSGVVAVAVQLEHGVHDVLDAAALIDGAGEVAQVLLARADALGQVGRADALVPRHDDLRVQGGDFVQAGDPRLAAVLVGLGGHLVHAVVDDVAAGNGGGGRHVQDSGELGVYLADGHRP